MPNFIIIDVVLLYESAIKYENNICSAFTLINMLQGAI